MLTNHVMITPAPPPDIIEPSSDELTKKRDKLIQDFLPLVKFIACRLATRLPAQIEIDDLISSGVIGLLDAIDKFDPSRNIKFKTYAEFRIRGAMLDELRNLDWVPRVARRKRKRIEQAQAKLQQQNGREISTFDIALHLEVTIDEVEGTLAETANSVIISLDDTLYSNQNNGDKGILVVDLIADQTEDIIGRLIDREQHDLLVQIVKKLPQTEQAVISLYYFSDLTLYRIGKLFAVTESRISQIHFLALKQLAKLLAEKVGHNGETVSLKKIHQKLFGR